MARLLGLDFGTGGVRVGVFDLDRRAVVAEREASYETRHPRPGWAEQSPLDWWEALGKATRGLMADLGAPEIDGVCVATTASTVVACKRDGTPLRPALLWMDCRAAEEADRTAASRHPVMAYSGGGDAAEWLVPKSMWLARHEPQTYAGAEVICECIDYVNFLLTGRWVGSRMNATCKWNYDSVAGRFVDDLYAEFGVPDLAAKLPSSIFPVGAPIERLSAKAAAHLGLSNRPVLAQGGIDAHIGMAGADTMAPGELLHDRRHLDRAIVPACRRARRSTASGGPILTLSWTTIGSSRPGRFRPAPSCHGCLAISSGSTSPGSIGCGGRRKRFRSGEPECSRLTISWAIVRHTAIRS